MPVNTCHNWWGWVDCCWHLVGRLQGCCGRFYNVQEIFLQRIIIWPFMSTGAKVERLGLKTTCPVLLTKTFGYREERN